MKAIFLYITAFITLVTLLGADDLMDANPLLFLIFSLASATLMWVCYSAIGYTEEDWKKYSGWNSFCKLLKIDNEL